MKAFAYFQKVIKHGGDKEFPDAFREIGHILRDRGVYRMANEAFKNYLKTYRQVHRRVPPDQRYIRDLMRY